MKFLSNVPPVRVLAGMIILLFFFASVSQNKGELALWAVSIQNIFLVAVSGVLAEFITRYFFLAEKRRVEDKIIRYGILLLLFSSKTPSLLFVVLSIGMELLRTFFRGKIGPTWNPVALIALLASFSGTGPDWINVSFSPSIPLFSFRPSIAFFIILPIAGYVARRYNKTNIILTAISAFSICFFAIFHKSPLPIIIESTFAFFLLVMVIEPRTSPSEKKEQIRYGLVIGSLLPIGMFFHLPDPLLLSLIIGNTYQMTKKWFSNAGSILGKKRN